MVSMQGAGMKACLHDARLLTLQLVAHQRVLALQLRHLSLQLTVCTPAPRTSIILYASVLVSMSGISALIGDPSGSAPGRLKRTGDFLGFDLLGSCGELAAQAAQLVAQAGIIRPCHLAS